MAEPLTEHKVQDIPDTRMADAIRLRDAMAVLLVSDGWKMLVKILNAQAATRQQQLLQAMGQPLQGSVDAVYAQEFKKGEAATFRVAAVLPETLRKGAEDTIAALRQKEEEEPPQREEHIEESEGYD